MSNIVKLTFIKGSQKYEVLAEEGLTLLDIANQNDIPLIGNCGGAISCGTCHVILSENTFNNIEQANDDEEDLLDIVMSTPTSRLGCCVKVTKELDGAEIIIA
jgi:ferredoxin